MSFLTPLFLLGGLAIGLPILFHLIRRTTRERKLFSSLMFLMASPPRLTKRNRLEHLLLLVLRCAVICLLAFGFARPFIQQAMAPPPGTGERILLLVDASASMRRADLWSEAKSKTEGILKKTSPADQVALYTFDRQIRPLFTFEQWKSTSLGERVPLLVQKLAETSPGWAATQLGSALVQAAETLSDAAGKTSTERRRIELITDLQEGSHLDQLQGYEWPKGVEVFVNIVKPRATGNAFLQLVSEADDSQSKAPENLRLRVSNLAGSKREQFKVGWTVSQREGFAGKPTDLYVPAAQSRVISLPPPTRGSLDRILLQGDDEDFDNIVFATPPASVRLEVVYIGTDSETDPKRPLYFLKRAFQETRRQTVRVTANHPEELLPANEVSSGSLIVVTAPLPDQSGRAIHEQVLAGKTLLVVANGAAMQPTLRFLLEAEKLNLEETRPASYAMLGEIDFRHPIFAPFADPRFSDFTKIHFWKYTRMDSALVPRARAIARFDNGDPAILEVPVGAGKVLVLTSGWEPDSSQLAVSSKFVPLLYSILENSSSVPTLAEQYRVGDVVPLAALSDSAHRGGTMRLPDGSQVSLQNNETNFSRTDLPGVYTYSSEAATRKFVVNMDPTESRTSPLAPDELERLGVPTIRAAELQGAQAERKVRIQNAETESRQKLWRWFIVGTLVMLLLESWLAGRTARRVAPITDPAPG